MEKVALAARPPSVDGLSRALGRLGRDVAAPVWCAGWSRKLHSADRSGARVDTDVLIVGAGAVGASTAAALSRQGHRVVVVEKESGPAAHQSGRNSGVIHAGYNLKPGSAKARYCVEGNRRLRAYCQQRGVAVQEGGILVVARDEAEQETLDELLRRSRANGVEARLVDADGIQDLEPHARGLAGLHAPEG